MDFCREPIFFVAFVTAATQGASELYSVPGPPRCFEFEPSSASRHIKRGERVQTHVHTK